MGTRERATQIPLADAPMRFAEDSTLVEELRSLKAKGYCRIPITIISDAPKTHHELEQERHDRLEGMLQEQLLDKLKRGELRAYGRDSRLPISEGMIKIPEDIWESAQIVDFADATIREDDYRITGIHVRLTPAAARIVDEKRCREWLAQLVRSGAQPGTKDEVFASLKDTFPGLPQAALERVWRDCAPPEWKRPGRKPRTRQTSPPKTR